MHLSAAKNLRLSKLEPKLGNSWFGPPPSTMKFNLTREPKSNDIAGL